MNVNIYVKLGNVGVRYFRVSFFRSGKFIIFVTYCISA